MDFSTVMLLAAAMFVVIVWLTSRKPKLYPPGPWKVPLIGNRYLFPLKISVRDTAMLLSKQYGEVSGLYSFGVPCVFVSGLDAVREGLNRGDLSGRPVNQFHNSKFGGPLGIINASGEPWKIQRRFIMHNLRNLGFGKSSLDGAAHEELKTVFEIIDERSGGCNKGCPNPVDMYDILVGSTGCVLWRVISGKRLNLKDPAVKKVFTASDNLILLNYLLTVINRAFGFLGWIGLTRLTGIFKLCSKDHPLAKLIQEAMDEHKKDVDYDDPRDLMDIYFQEIKKQEKCMPDIFNEKQLKRVCSELVAGENESMVKIITFGILYMILHPEVQRKVQEELDEVIGKERLPSISDKIRLPYTEATLNEVLRLSSVAPTTPPHAPLTNEEYIIFRGYHIPKGSLVIFNMYGLHHDPTLWKCPEEFIPERFLPGSEVSRDAFIPFSAGKRACPGEILARNNLFIFFAGLLQRYSMKVPDGHPLPTMKGVGTTTLCPLPFKVKVQLR